MPTVLVTGFDPFENEPINPSWEAVRTLDGQGIAGAEIIARQLPTIFGESNKVLGKLLQTLHPDVVIAVGQAGGRAEMAIERIAINVDDARIADNAGKQPIDIAIASDGRRRIFQPCRSRPSCANCARAGSRVGLADGGDVRLQSRLLWVDARHRPSQAAHARRLHPHPVSAVAVGQASGAAEHGARHHRRRFAHCHRDDAAHAT